MNSKRSHQINTRSKEQGKCVIYLMSRDQRVKDNHALYEAQNSALEKKLPLLVVFNLIPQVSNRLRNQYSFMLEGLKQVENILRKNNIPLQVDSGDMVQNVCRIEKELNPAAIFFDFSPLNGPQNMYKKIAENVSCPCIITDTHNIVPVRIATDKEEWAAYTIRPKIQKLLPFFLKEPQQIIKHPYQLQKTVSNDWKSIQKKIMAKEEASYQTQCKSGEKHAAKATSDFIEKKLAIYNKKRNDPTSDSQSNLSPYLHFGQISSLRIALTIQQKLKNSTDTIRKSSQEVFFEELIIRKELSDNYCYYNKNYNNINGARPWAEETLNEHRKDKRPYLYSDEEFEHASTHDDAWNAAQNQMRSTGKMHGYMRMYWAKKILEWSKTPEKAIETAIYLNDKYELDGYDPNGYTGIMWSIAGVHDRAWPERNIFGKIRYMNYNGLKRKLDIESYIKKWKKDKS